MNLFQRINAVRKAVGYIQKDKSVSTGGGSYKAVTHDQVTAQLRGAMIEHGVVCFPNLVSSVMNPPMVNVDGTQAKQSRYDATYDFVFVNAEQPEDRITIRIEAHSMDNADKAPGKALSYGMKYALLKLFMLETGEDEESRYQRDDFDLDKYLKQIGEAKDMDELKTRYAEAFGAASDAKDKDAAKAVIKAKDARKNELMCKEAPNA